MRLILITRSRRPRIRQIRAWGTISSVLSRGVSEALNNANLFWPRRQFLSAGAAGAAGAVGIGALFTPGVFAQKLIQTPRQTEGPFYPNKMPLDTDNDLLIINDSITPAVGAVTYLSGRILDSRGEPIRSALVEIWQCDNNGAYLHTN